MIEALIFLMASFSGDIEQVCNKNVYEIENLTKGTGLSPSWDSQHGGNVEKIFPKFESHIVKNNEYIVYFVTIDGNYYTSYVCRNKICSSDKNINETIECSKKYNIPCVGAAIKTKNNLYCIFRSSPSDYKFYRDE